MLIPQRKATIKTVSHCLLALMFCLGTTSGAPSSGEEVKNDAAATAATIKEDDLLYADMEKVASRLKRYIERLGHFPHHGEEMGHALARLNRAAPVNPYEAPENGKKIKTRVSLIVDKSLTRDTITKIEDKLAPYWSGEPGTITVIANKKDLMLVWGAGMDSKPIKDAKTGKLRLVIAQLPVAATPPKETPAK